MRLPLDIEIGGIEMTGQDNEQAFLENANAAARKIREMCCS